VPKWKRMKAEDRRRYVRGIVCFLCNGKCLSKWTTRQRAEAVVRYLGLGLFAVVAWKVFFVDLAQLDQIYRIVAFLSLGILVLAGSCMYLKFRDTVATEKAEGEPPSAVE
ncbi:MAG: DUF2339 domain-containing protein, partial [Pirellulales bacterium]